MLYSELNRLPSVDNLKKRFQSIAALDAILMPDWQLRYYSFNSKWAPGKTMGSMRNGSGNEFFALFSKAGVVVKGFDQDTAKKEKFEKIQNKSLTAYKNIPKTLSDFLLEPAFSVNEVSFCIWSEYSTPWKHGEIDADSENALEMLDIFINDENFYKKWAIEYYEVDVSISSLASIYNFEPLSESLAKNINPDVDFKELKKDMIEIDYPVLAQ